MWLVGLVNVLNGTRKFLTQGIQGGFNHLSPFSRRFGFIECTVWNRFANDHLNGFIPLVENLMREKGQFNIGFYPQCLPEKVYRIK